jgi:hypothetical protein
MPIPHWFEDSNAWDTLTLGPHQMPGIWTVDGPIKRAIDVKKSKGQDGARLKDEGQEPGGFDIVGKLVSKEDWDKLQVIMPDLHPKKLGGEREATAIDHPATSLIGIEFIYINEIYTPTIDNGILMVRMHAFQWTKTPPVKKKQKNQPAKPGGVDVAASPPPSTDKLSNVTPPPEN